ncbi:hypothetical protein Poly51_42800 [Rubripirellula tenax]|uniref:Uncharacterized protein n=1 Tax=Rubripirellula tenax TaxID=2528015 RepID=A0A5C6ESA6_9BACT|nr:hypothetical protein [Rubripirellula tenax]TWU50987.1 hypothetical protein Poly51_42800 [Rubripirellula tenax]
MSLDRSLPKLATKMVAAESDTARTKLLRQEVPRLYRHLKRVRIERGLLSRWGMSVNLDELAGVEIVSPDTLRVIGQCADITMQPPAYHAGLQHTYGYLLSLVETPYGYKRDRWLSDRIEVGFGLPRHSLNAFPRRGTLLGNLTDFLVRLSLREGPPAKSVGAVAEFDKQSLERTPGTRIVEEIRGDDRDTILLRTDLFPMPYTPGEGLLVYSIKKSRSGWKLVTTFPIEQPSWDELLSPSRFGNEQPIKVRYNGFVNNFPADGVLGKRTKTDL